MIDWFIEINRDLLTLPEFKDVSWYAGLGVGGLGIPDPIALATQQSRTTSTFLPDGSSISDFQRAFHCYVGSGSIEDIFYESTGSRPTLSVDRAGSVVTRTEKRPRPDLKIDAPVLLSDTVVRNPMSGQLEVLPDVSSTSVSPERTILTRGPEGRFQTTYCETTCLSGLAKFKERIASLKDSFFAMIRKSGLPTDMFVAKFLRQFRPEDVIYPRARTIELCLAHPCQPRELLRMIPIPVEGLTYLSDESPFLLRRRP